jgi:hypothetical protein
MAPPQTGTSKARQGRLLVVILGLAVLLRIAVAIYLGDIVDAPPLLTDQRSYDALGARLVTGHGFSFDRGWYPFTAPDTPTAHWSFLYSLFVAAIYGAAGIHPLAVRVAQGIAGGILLPWLTYRLTKRVFAPADGSRVGWLPYLAALFAAIYAYFVLYAATLMTETFFIAALLWSLDEILALAQNPRPLQGVRLGLALGIAALLRQSILPWAVVAYVWLFWVVYRRGQWRQAVVSLLCSTGVIAALIVPFTIRNYVVYGQFLLLNSNAGYAMYSAQNPMHGTDFQEFAAAPVPPEVLGHSEPQMDRELMRRGIGFVLAEPGRYLLLSLSRARAYFEFWPTPDTTLLNNLGRVGSFGLFLPFMLYGLFVALRKRSAFWDGHLPFASTPLALLLLFAVFYSLMHIFTWAMPRYRLPVDAVMLLFAALAVMDLVERARALRVKGRQDIIIRVDF